MAKTAKMEDPKRKCAELCLKALVRCARDVEKAIAACGVEVKGMYDDPAGAVMQGMMEWYEPDDGVAKLSGWKPTSSDIRSLSLYFRKVYTKKGGQ